MSASPESLALLGRAAELRATGTPWTIAATQLSVGHDELRRIVDEHAGDYERLARRARAEFRLEAVHEAVAALRSLLGSADHAERRLASASILRFEMTRLRHGVRDAGLEVERFDRRERTPGAEAQNVRAANLSESPK